MKAFVKAIVFSKNASIVYHTGIFVFELIATIKRETSWGYDNYS
jgi:hypothetical protein